MQADIIEFEKQVLGAVKGNQNLIDDFNITENLFSNSLNKKFFNVMKSIHVNGIKIDSLNIYDKIKDSEISKEMAYYEKLETFYQSNAEYYIEKLKEIVRLRELELLKLHISDWIKEGSESKEIINKIDEKITNLINNDNDSLMYIKDCLFESIKEIEEFYKLGGRIKGIQSGFSKLDYMLNGFNDQNYIIIGARPSVGKTSLVLNMINHIGSNGIPIGFFSCETTRTMIMQRMISSKAYLNLMSIRMGKVTKENFNNLTEACNNINEFKMWIDDKSNMNLSHIKMQSRRMVRRGVKIIFLDYIGMVKHENKNLPRWEQMSDVSRSCKGLARELNIPFIVLSQVKRETEGKRPTLADLRESGDIEADADVVIFIHKEREKNDAELIIAKNRDGPTGIINIYFKPEVLTFYEKTEEKQ